MADQDQRPEPSETPPEPVQLTDESAAAREPRRFPGPQPIRIRPWPKTIMMAPSFLGAALCVVILLVFRPDLQQKAAPAAAATQAASVAVDESGTPSRLGLARNLGLIYMCILSVNLLVVFYDIRV